MATNFIIGTSVVCTDSPCGHLERAVIDPEALTLTHLAVEPAASAARGPPGPARTGRQRRPRDQASLQRTRVHGPPARRRDRVCRPWERALAVRRWTLAETLPGSSVGGPTAEPSRSSTR